MITICGRRGEFAGLPHFRDEGMDRRSFVAKSSGVLAGLGLARLAQPIAASAEILEPSWGGGPRPAHHNPKGGFVNPWPTAEREDGGFWRWQRERRSKELAPDPPADALPVVASDIAYPHAPADEVWITWVGHATFLIQIGGLNLLTDPHWSQRASPVQLVGPARLVEPGIPWERLPPIDGVLLSHDHYDHLDEGTIRRVHKRWGKRVQWFTPLGYRGWFRSQGVRQLNELDWWQEATLDGATGRTRIIALPAQHWTSRTPWDRQEKLWGSWAIVTPSGRKVYFGGDSGWFPGYPEIGERAGPFDAVLLPIGAYDPRWFMRPVHMNPEEAVRAYRELGGQGTFAAMHWGTFRLTDEDPLEPPQRIRAAWKAAELANERLWVARHGETRIIAG